MADRIRDTHQPSRGTYDVPSVGFDLRLASVGPGVTGSPAIYWGSASDDCLSLDLP